MQQVLSAQEGVVTPTARKTVLTTQNLYEQRFGYFRAVKRGPFICVSGSTALFMDSDNIPQIEHPGDPYKQALHAMQTCINAVTNLHGCVEDIIRVRMFVSVGTVP